MSDVGFTGTQDGCTDAQLQQVAIMLMGRRGSRFRHGDCVGADDQCAYLAHLHGLYVIGHPPVKENKRAFNKFTSAWCEPESYLDRNRTIVNQTDWLLATPKGDELGRSGTWSTIRYAVNQGKDVAIVHPDGRVEVREGTR